VEHVVGLGRGAYVLQDLDIIVGADARDDEGADMDAVLVRSARLAAALNSLARRRSMVSAKTRDSAGRMLGAEATATETVGQEASSRMRGAAASRAWRRVPGGGNEGSREVYLGGGSGGSSRGLEVDAPVHGGSRRDPFHHCRLSFEVPFVKIA
jgi:hypothetical protein